MSYKHQQIADVATILEGRYASLETKSDILKAPELKGLYDQIRELPGEERASFGQEVNQLRQALQARVEAAESEAEQLPPLDVTAPMDINATKPGLIAARAGYTTPHPSRNRVHGRHTTTHGFSYL